MSLRVINLGLPKSGTTTLARALRRAGLSTIDHKIRPEQTENPDLSGAYVGELIYLGYFEQGDPLAHLSDFSAISEMSVMREGRSLWPQTDFGVIDALRRLHPETRFIATRRDAFLMSQSMLAWSNLGDRLPQADIPGLPTGFGDTTKARIQWIEAHHAHLRAIFAGDPRFLELDIAAPDARDRLAAHLGLRLPWWGRSNTNPLTTGRARA
ncbi:MAG: sulfotransferase family protein [Rhodobacteraceae bacterium]|nr:MAG: sulfotransferase family protein [Paracoccaceae bacterium]